LFREVEVARSCREDQHDRDVRQAWHFARFYAEVRFKGRLPDLQQCLAGGTSNGGQTIGQQKAVLAMLAAQTGYPVKWADS
jgi:hypothetical protein